MDDRTTQSRTKTEGAPGKRLAHRHLGTQDKEPQEERLERRSKDRIRDEDRDGLGGQRHPREGSDADLNLSGGASRPLLQSRRRSEDTKGSSHSKGFPPEAKKSCSGA